MHTWETSTTTDNVLMRSVHGVNKEINKRTWKICELVQRVTGNEKRFIKPVKNQYPVMLEALSLRREVEKLKVIRKELNEAINKSL